MDDSAIVDLALRKRRAQHEHWTHRAEVARTKAATPRTRSQAKDPGMYLRAQAKKRAKFDALKQGPCADCGGVFHPFVMDLDHRDGETKLFAISLAYNMNLPWEKVLAERAKCDLVCANCHRMRTLRRKEAAKLPVPPSPIDPTRCRRGHPRTPDSTYFKPSGRRECRVCAKIVEAQRTERRRLLGRRQDWQG